MKRRVIATIALSASVLLLGCSAADQRAQSPTESGETPAQTVNILTHDSFALPDELVEKFQSETGYTLKTSSPGDSGVVLNQLILAKDNPTVDGVYGIDNFSAHTAIDEGVLDAYVSPALPDSAQGYRISDELTPTDMGQVCVNVDPAWFENANMAVPTTLDELAQPEYAKLLVIENPAQSSPGFAFLAATVAAKGEDGYQDYWTKLLEGGTKVDPGWSDAYNADFSGGEGKGDYPLVLSYSSSPVASDGATRSIDATCTQQVEYTAVVKGAKNPDGAKAFIDFMLSDDVQQALPDNMFIYPVNSTLALPEVWTKYATLSATPIETDSQQVAENRETWLKEWTTLYEESTK